MCVLDHWPFQDPKLEVPTVYKAYVRLVKGNIRNIPLKYGFKWYCWTPMELLFFPKHPHPSEKLLTMDLVRSWFPAKVVPN